MRQDVAGSEAQVGVGLCGQQLDTKAGDLSKSDLPKLVGCRKRAIKLYDDY